MSADTSVSLIWCARSSAAKVVPGSTRAEIVRMLTGSAMSVDTRARAGGASTTPRPQASTQPRRHKDAKAERYRLTFRFSETIITVYIVRRAPEVDRPVHTPHARR